MYLQTICRFLGAKLGIKIEYTKFFSEKMIKRLKVFGFLYKT